MLPSTARKKRSHIVLGQSQFLRDLKHRRSGAGTVDRKVSTPIFVSSTSSASTPTGSRTTSTVTVDRFRFDHHQHLQPVGRLPNVTSSPAKLNIGVEGGGGSRGIGGTVSKAVARFAVQGSSASRAQRLTSINDDDCEAAQSSGSPTCSQRNRRHSPFTKSISVCDTHTANMNDTRASQKPICQHQMESGTRAGNEYVPEVSTPDCLTNARGFTALTSTFRSIDSVVDSNDSRDSELVTVSLEPGNLASVLTRHSRHHPNEQFVKLNIAGTKYYLRPATVLKRSHFSLLYRFVVSSHADRLTKADGFFDETSEYFFERSAQSFEPIYRYYATGLLHKPRDLCLDDFMDEMHYWELPVQALAPCCWHEIGLNDTDLDLPKTPEPESDGFDELCCGRMRRQIWNLVEVPESSMPARVFAFISILFVLLSNAGLVIGSIPECQVELKPRDEPAPNVTWVPRKPVMVPHPYLVYVEYVCVSWFTMEYFAKIAVAAQRWRVFKQTLNLIDLAAILPFFFELTLQISGIDTESMQDLKGAFLVIRILRVLRVIRIFKLGRYSSGLQTFALTLLQSMKQLGMMGMVLMTGVIFFSTLVYFLEKDEPDTQFTSIPASFWWCIVTMTTVGYGDVVPETVGGKLVASGAIACGVLVLALPITIIVDNFMKISDDPKDQQQQGQG